MAYLLIKGKKEGGTRDFSFILVSILQDYPSNIINHEVMPYISVIYVSTVAKHFLVPHSPSWILCPFCISLEKGRVSMP